MTTKNYLHKHMPMAIAMTAAVMKNIAINPESQ